MTTTLSPTMFSAGGSGRSMGVGYEEWREWVGYEGRREWAEHEG